MKSIIYILITVFICSILISAIPNFHSKQKQVIDIQSVNANSDPKLIIESCSVMKQRLNDYNLKNFDISADTIQKIIEISFSEKTDIHGILPLILSTGKVEFFETYHRNDFINKLDKGDKLFSILNIAPADSENSAILGYCKPVFTSRVDSCLKRQSGVKFMWSKKLNTNGNAYLYLLKGNAVLTNQHLLNASAEENNLSIAFNETGALIWQDVSKNNLNKSIAMVIDNKVCFAPVLKTQINDGKCTITGNFTSKEVAQLKSLVNNGELPLEFRLLK